MLIVTLLGAKMVEVTQDYLTDSTMAAILTPLSRMTVRDDSRKKQEMPTQARLLIDCVIKCSKFYGGRYLGSESSQDSLVLSVNPDNVHRPIFDRIKRWSLTFKRDQSMNKLQNHSAQNSEQTTPIKDGQDLDHAQTEQTTQALPNAVQPAENFARSPALDAIKKAIGEVVCYGGIMLETNSRVDLQILSEVTEELLEAIVARRVELKAAQTVGGAL